MGVDVKVQEFYKAQDDCFDRFKEVNEIKRFEDMCEHGEDAYIGSFKVYSVKGCKKYDLYVFKSKAYGQEVCIRYGDESGCEYISPGDLLGFIRRSNNNEIYSKAYDLLVQEGRLLWIKKGK